MGGNALKAYGVERKERHEYDLILDHCLAHLRDLFPQVRLSPIVAYSDKVSFGDADILISDTLYQEPHWCERIREAFQSQGWFSNTDVHSFEYQKLQIDLIVVPEASFDFAQTYFNYNDLGNLIGRIAHKMGFKFGHLGLLMPLRDGDHQFAELAITRDSRAAFEFLGYDFDEYQKGFKNLEAIFQYVISSPYVHRSIYQLEQRNRKARYRDTKRTTYIAFLQWLEHHPEANRFDWLLESTAKTMLKKQWLDKAIHLFPLFKLEYEKILEEHQNNKAFKLKWNGKQVANWTGLQGQALGAKMAQAAQRPQFKEWVMSVDESALRAYVLHLPD